MLWCIHRDAPFPPQASDAAGLQSHLDVARGELEAARKQLGEAAAARADLEQRLAASVAECERAKQQAQVRPGQAGAVCSVCSCVDKLAN